MRVHLILELEHESEKGLADLIESATKSAGGPGKFVDAYPVPDDLWESDPDYPRGDWELEVANGDTDLGYWCWVDHQRESDREDNSDG